MRKSGLRNVRVPVRLSSQIGHVALPLTYRSLTPRSGSRHRSAGRPARARVPLRPRSTPRQRAPSRGAASERSVRLRLRARSEPRVLKNRALRPSGDPSLVCWSKIASYAPPGSRSPTGKSTGGRLASLSRLALAPRRAPKTLVGVRRLPRRAGSCARESRVDGAEPPLPRLRFPPLGGEVFVAFDQQRYLLSGAEVLDDVGIQSVPEVPDVSGPREFPGRPRGRFLVGASHGLLEQAGDRLPAVSPSVSWSPRLFPRSFVPSRADGGPGVERSVGAKRRLSLLAHRRSPFVRVRYDSCDGGWPSQCVWVRHGGFGYKRLSSVRLVRRNDRS